VDSDIVGALPRALEEWYVPDFALGMVSAPLVAALPRSMTIVPQRFFKEAFLDELPPNVTQSADYLTLCPPRLGRLDLLAKFPQKIHQLDLNLRAGFEANPSSLPLRITHIPLKHLTYLKITVPPVQITSWKNEKSKTKSKDASSSSNKSTQKQPTSWFDEAFVMDIGTNLLHLRQLDISSSPMEDPSHLDYIKAHLEVLVVDCNPSLLNFQANWAVNLQVLNITCSEAIQWDHQHHKDHTIVIEGGKVATPSSPLAHSSKHKKRRPVRKRTKIKLGEVEETEPDDYTIHFAEDVVWPTTLTKLWVKSTNFEFGSSSASFPPNLHEIKLSLSLFPVKAFRILPPSIRRIYAQVEENTSAKAFLHAIRSLPREITILDVIGSDKISDMISGYGKSGIEFREWIDEHTHLASLGLDVDEEEAAASFWPSRQFKHLVGVSYPFQLGSKRTTPAITRSRTEK
jgi:hypothetical protein